MKWRLAFLLVCAVLAAPAQADDRSAYQSSSGEGEVYIYIEPLPREAERISFSIEKMSVVSESGAEAPLKLAFTTIKPAENRRQRLLAAGRLPAGSHTGLSIKVQKASLHQDAGEAALVVPDTATVVTAPFLVSGGGAVVLWLSFTGAPPPASDVSFTPAFAARVAPRPISGRAGFASSARANTVTMFDKRLRAAAVVIPTAGGPSGMALDQRLGRLYVACARDDEIQVIDVLAAEIVERSRLAPGDGAREIALTPDGRTLLSANATSNTVSVFDASPLTRLERIAVGSGPSALAIDPSGRRAFVFNTLSSSISVIDIGNRRLVATISTDAAPLRGQFSARGDRLYVIHDRSPYMTVLDPVQLSVVTRARLRIGLGAVAVDARRGLLYIGGRRDPMIEFYDPNTLLPIGAMKARSGVSHLAIDVEENVLYMISPDTRSIVVSGLAERKVVTEIDVGEGPYWVSIMGER